jgi:chemosensory pili system protein ChpA (sensor histidine kinase/response regulator)
LAWVLDELRKSLDGATKAMQRFVRDAELARGSGLSELDASHLRVARQQLHQAVGALEMVGMAAPAKLLHAMEAAVQKFVQHPEQCSDDAANRIERASFALAEFLEGVLKGKTASSVALFPQYRAVMELAGAERIHPADLWATEWRWLPIPQVSAQRPLPYTPEVRAILDQAVLKIVKTADAAAASTLSQVCTALATGQKALESHTFWMIAAGYFDAMAHALLPADIYTKRTASRILQQYAALAKGESGPSERLAQDLVFFCAQAHPVDPEAVAALAAVRSVYGLSDSMGVDYELAQFGRFDPAQLTLARKRIASAAETWSALAGGDTGRLAAAAEQFGAVADSILKLHPQNRALAQALQSVMEATVRSGAAPSPAVAMEVATSVLYLEAAYEDLDPTDDQMVERSNRLAQRLQNVRDGAEPEPLEAWMEELYRRVSDRQTMGSVVDELRTSLGEVETGLDQFFRNPTDLAPLRDVPSRLAQMRGVFSVLGLDQPAIAALRMRSSVDRLLIGDVDIASARTGLFEKLGNSLGALGLLIDMLSYQRAMAKKLFVYDEEAGEFKPLMGRERSQIPEASPAPFTEEVEQDAVQAAVQEMPAPIPPPQVVAPEPEDDDEEMREIFLEEAREVVANGEAALQQLAVEPANLADQTTVRRAFHTLKGSSRMVGLNEFGEAAWAFEQLFNAWLAEQKPASADLLNLSSQAMTAFGRWVQDIADKADVPWQAAAFRKAADALRLQGQLLPLQVPGWVEPEPVPEPEPSLGATAMPDHALVHDPLAPVEAVDSFEHPPEEFDADFLHTRSGDLGDSLLPDFTETSHGRDKPEFVATAAFEDPLLPRQTTSADAPLDFANTQMFGVLLEEDAREASDSVSPDDFDLGNMDFSADVEAQPGKEDPLDAVRDPLELTSHALDSAPQTVAGDLDFTLGDPEPTALPEDTPDAAPEELAATLEMPLAAHAEPATLTDEDEQTKVIGDLRLGIPLYNVYLNEADEWSRRLITELAEWSLELHRPLPQSAVMLAHSLGGSSATVGFNALAEVARTLEQALDHVRLHEQGHVAHAQVFNDAAEDIRRLLHQFAAGFLKTADAAVLQALQDIVATEFAPPVAVDAVVESDDIELPLDVEAQEASVEAAEPAIEAQDRLDADLFPIFQEEAAELLPALGTALRQWVARPENGGARAEALRVLHTLKGSARLAGALRLGEMAHRMESSVEALGTDDVQTSQLEPLLGRLDVLQNTMDVLDRAPREDVSVAPAPPAVTAPLARDLPNASVVPVSSTQAPAAPPVEVVTRATPRSLPVQSVRVRAPLLDRLVNQAGEVMISRSRLDSRIVQMRSALTELTSNLDRLRRQLRDVEVQAESQMQSRMALSKDDTKGFDPLEFDRFTRVQELTRMMAESVNDVATVQRNMQRAVEGAEDDLMAQGRQARELQRDVLRTRMVEFDGISERLYGVVRQAAKETGKQVKLDIAGGNIEMDRGILDRMTPAFEHILRNAVAHGIESAEVRQAAGKEPVGAIHIRVHQEGNDVTVEFADDGGGLHLDKIRAKAIANQLIASDAVLSDQDAAKLLFAPGFSTAAQVTELSGRGIGMDVVLTELNALGGRVETQTAVGKGTTFRLILPLTTAVTQVVLLRLGDFTIGVPANLMETVLRVPLAEVQAAYEQGSFTWAGQPIAFFWGGALLQGSGRSTDPQARNLPVAIFRSAGQRLALHVDEVLGNREVVVKNLGPQLSQLPGLAGMSMLASGAVVLIYNPVALATVYGAQATALSAAAHAAPAVGATTLASAQQGEALAPLVLVVDDSITVRRVTQRLLKREGFRVALANDGLHALEVLRDEKPAVVLSDIEMPRMDGFELVRNIRADETMRDLPVIMITSRIAQKHRDHAVELGVDHYLGKPYAEDELLALIRSYCTDLIEV